MTASQHDQLTTTSDAALDVPIDGYDNLRVADIIPLLADLNDAELRAVERRERDGKGRVMVLNRIAMLRTSRRSVGQAASTRDGPVQPTPTRTEDTDQSTPEAPRPAWYSDQAEMDRLLAGGPVAGSGVSGVGTPAVSPLPPPSGWWLASDGKWYPPQSTPPAPPAILTGEAHPVVPPAQSWPDDGHQREQAEATETDGLAMPASVTSTTAAGGAPNDGDVQFCGQCGGAVTGPFCAQCGKPAVAAVTASGIAIGEVDRAGRVRISGRGIAVVTFIVLVIVGGSLGAWKLLARASATHHTITGTVVLTDSSSDYADMTNGQSCSGQDGYDDIDAGTEVQISNQTGTILATGALGSGTIQSVVCVFTFSVPNVPSASFYQIEVSHRGNVTFSKSELEGNGWSAGLTLGS